MQFTQISDGSAILEVDPDEAALLAAACKIAHFYADEPGCTLVANPLDALGGAAATSLALAGYAAMFEAVMVASLALFNVQPSEGANLTLSALRARGVGWRRAQCKLESDEEPAGKESEAAR